MMKVLWTSIKFFGGVLGTSLVWEVKRTKQIALIGPRREGGDLWVVDGLDTSDPYATHLVGSFGFFDGLLSVVSSVSERTCEHAVMWSFMFEPCILYQNFCTRFSVATKGAWIEFEL